MTLKMFGYGHGWGGQAAGPQTAPERLRNDVDTPLTVIEGVTRGARIGRLRAPDWTSEGYPFQPSITGTDQAAETALNDRNRPDRRRSRHLHVSEIGRMFHGPRFNRTNLHLISAESACRSIGKTM